MLQIVLSNARPVIPHHELHAIAVGLQTQLHRTFTRGMAQGVVQQVAQRRDRQHGGHLHRGVRKPGRHLEPDTLAITAGRILYRQFRHLLGAALHAVIERQTAFDPCQQQQLLQGPVQAVGPLFGPGQGLIPRGTLGHARHLQVGLDRGQRAAQLVSRIAGQSALTLDGLADSLEQLILRIQQGLQFAGQRLDLQGLERIRAAPH